MATALMIQLFGEGGSWFAVVLVAPLIWIFGEIVPKSIFQQRADAITPVVIFPLRLFSYLFFPILVIFSRLTRLFVSLLGDNTGTQNPFTLREEIAMLMQMSSDGGDIQSHEKTMIRRLFDFEETAVREVMMPLIDVVGVEQDATCGEAIRVAREQSHKRLPVYAKRVDHIVGVLDTLELLGVDQALAIKQFIKPADYVPGSKSIQALLQEMQRDHQLLSVVVDEFGGAEGIVTLEDIVEEIVEDISDEYDAHEKPVQWVRKLGENDYLVSGRIDPGSFEDELGISLPEGVYASLAGFLLERVRDVPTAGTVVKYNKITFTVDRASSRVIEVVRVHW
jgi:putative hemolysin